MEAREQCNGAFKCEVQCVKSVCGRVVQGVRNQGIRG